MALLFVLRRAGKGDELGLQALPCRSRLGGCLSRLSGLAGLSGFAHAVQAQSHMPPELAGSPFLCVKAAHYAIGIHGHLRVAQGCGHAGKALQWWCGFALRGAGDGQNHFSAFLQRQLQQQVIAGVVQVFFAEDDIQPNGARLALLNAFQCSGVQGAAPGPAANAVNAVVINGDDDDIG